MKTLYVGFFLFLAVTACSTKESSETDSTAMETPASLPDVAEKPAELTDPDPTDDIPPGQYLEASASIATAEIVKTALQKQFKDDIDKNLLEESARKFVQFEYDLNGDGINEILVGLVGPYFCGSGGCTQFVLDHEGNVVTVFSVADYPVIISADKSKGWNDLIIFSGGKNRTVKFDGTKYPSNPSVQPALETAPADGLPRALDFINEKYPWFKF